MVDAGQHANDAHTSHSQPPRARPLPRAAHQVTLGQSRRRLAPAAKPVNHLALAGLDEPLRQLVLPNHRITQLGRHLDDGRKPHAGFRHGVAGGQDDRRLRLAQVLRMLGEDAAHLCLVQAVNPNGRPGTGTGPRPRRSREGRSSTSVNGGLKSSKSRHKGDISTSAIIDPTHAQEPDAIVGSAAGVGRSVGWPRNLKDTSR